MTKLICDFIDMYRVSEMGGALINYVFLKMPPVILYLMKTRHFYQVSCNTISKD